MFTKKKVEKHKQKVNQILKNHELSAKEKGAKLLGAFGELEGWFFKDKNYENELMDVIDDFLKENDLKIADYL